MVYIKSNAEQTILLPTDLRTIIPKDHICYLIENVIKQYVLLDIEWIMRENKLTVRRI